MAMRNEYIGSRNPCVHEEPTGLKGFTNERTLPARSAVPGSRRWFGAFTPAIEVGISDHVWSLEEIVASIA